MVFCREATFSAVIFVCLEIHRGRNLAAPTLEHEAQLKEFLCIWILDKLGRQKVTGAVGEWSSGNWQEPQPQR